MSTSVSSMSLDAAIDSCCASRGAHYDVALVAAIVLAGRFRYVGDQRWEWWDDTVRMWRPDDQRNRLEQTIRMELCQCFVERALFWNERSMTIDVAHRVEHQLRSQLLLWICLRIPKESYLPRMIKELRALLLYET